MAVRDRWRTNCSVHSGLPVASLALSPQIANVAVRATARVGGREPSNGGRSMKLSMERSALLRAMGRAQSVVERRNTIPILANVLIEAEGDRVSFRATDLDIEVIDRAPAMVIARRRDDGRGPHAARDRPQAARRRAGRADRRRRRRAARGAGRTVALQLADAAARGFPDHGERRIRANFACPAPVLRRLFDKAKFAISTEETRYYLNGVYMHAAQGAGRPGAALRGDRRPPAGPDRRAPARGRGRTCPA